MEKTVILNQNRDFLQLYQRGKKIASPYVIIYLRKTRRKHNRLGITVGKKVGCAVKRSRARRIIRQAYRETEHLMPVGVDLVIVALPSITGLRSTQLRDYLAGSGVRRIRLYQKVSRLTPAVCRFYPTCSCYAQTAVLRFGVVRGGFLALRRLLRCHPWNPGGIDYVPESLEPPRAVFGRYVRTLRHNRKG